MLYQWGQIQWDVMPFNVHKVEDMIEMDFARKEIMDTSVNRESTGPGEREMVMSGKIFPRKIGGLTEMALFEQVQLKQVAQQMIRGDGRVLGWYVCTRLHKVGGFLLADGVPQQIEFEAQFFRADTPKGDEYFSTLYGVASGGNGGR
jgi:phage protein U